MQARSKSIILLALLTNLLVSPAQVVEAKSLNLFPLKPLQPSGVPTRFTPFPPFKPRPTPPNPAPTPEPAPEPEQVALTLEQIAAGELALKNAIIRYTVDMERAEENYSSARTSNDMLSWDLASDELYLDELQAEYEFWRTADEWQAVAQVPLWAAATAKVSLELAAQSPVVQVKAAAIMAALGAVSALGVSELIATKTNSLKILTQKQREAIDSRVKELLWQMDYGGLGQPAPNSDLESLFPGCQIQYTCVDAWVCTTNSGSNRDCEKQQVCESRIVKC